MPSMSNRMASSGASFVRELPLRRSSQDKSETDERRPAFQWRTNKRGRQETNRDAGLSGRVPVGRHVRRSSRARRPRNAAARLPRPSCAEPTAVAGAVAGTGAA